MSCKGRASRRSWGLLWSAASSRRIGLLALVLALGALLLPAVALADVQPDVTTDSSKPITASEEFVAGTVNPHGLSTGYYAEYAAASSQWCISGAAQGTPSSTSSVTLGHTDSAPHDVTVDVSGLTGGTTYCAELIATNTGGTAFGPQITFTAGLPVVTTSSADATGVQHAVVRGTVDPASQSTTYFAEYGLANSAWCTSGGQTGSPLSPADSPTALGGNQDALAHSVTFNVTELEPATDYCVAIAASNPSSTAAGASVTGSPFLSFTTETPVTTDSVQSTSASAIQLSGSVNPDGVSTDYNAAYDQVGSDWCQGRATSDRTLKVTTPSQTLLATDQVAHNVTVNITGLTPSATYCVALRSTNTHLDSSGDQLPITVGLPTATTSDVQPPDTATTAVLDGVVGPSGQSTTYHVVYDRQSSPWCLSNGTLGPASNATALQLLTPTDSGEYAVSVAMPNLTPGTQYCAALAADNGSGPSDPPSPSTGPPIDFTAGIAPTASTSAVLDQTASQSAVSGVGNAEGQTSMYHIAYDTADSPWCLASSGDPSYTTADQPIVSPADTSDHAVTMSVTGLQGGTTYCAAVVATNDSGSVTAPTVQFVAGVPTATASTTTAVSPSTETLTGTINPTTQAATYYAAYDSANSYWCRNGGDPTSASFKTSPLPLGGAVDNTAHDVFVGLTGLTPGAGYCVELVAVNSSATNASSALSFAPGFPFTVTTSTTNNVTDSSVTVGATLNPGDLGSSYWVGYDTQDSVWCSSGGQSAIPGMTTNPTALPSIDTSDHAIAVAVNGLSAHTAYCAELVAENESGIVHGTQVRFTTANTPAVVRPPSIAIRTTSPTSPTTATVTGPVNPGGQQTSYHAAYAPVSSSFCRSGVGNGQASTTAPATLRFTDSAAHTVTVSLSGLKTGTSYCAQFLAENASGAAHSALASFTTIGRPHLSGLRLAPAKFTAAKHGATTMGKLPKDGGTRVSYRDTQWNTVVTFTVTWQRSGARNRHGVCGKRAKGSKGHCGYTAVVGRFTKTAGDGANQFVFTGRLGGHKLAFGSYRLQAVAVDRWHLSSSTVTVSFVIR